MRIDRATHVVTRTAAALIVLSLAGCCAGPPLATEPLTSSELDRIASAVDATAREFTALRGSGSGLLSTQEQRSPFAFAAVYDTPGWLRADLRPTSPAAPSGFAAHLRVEGACADLLFPSSLVMVTDCLDGTPFSDPALLFFGAFLGDDLRRLEDARASENDDAISLTGRCGEQQISIALARGTSLLTRVEVRTDDESWLTLDYEGHGWKDSIPLPRTTVIRIGRKGRTQARLRFDFDRLRVSDPVERSTLDLVVPPGTTVSTWGDLTLWR